MNCVDILNNHKELKRRNDASILILNEVRERFTKSIIFKKDDLTIFCAGSLARGEKSENSDLDLFAVAEHDDPLKGFTRLYKLKMLNEWMNINEELKFPEISNDAEFLRLNCLKQMTEKTGSPKDDAENLFTTRMLLLLESKYTLNEQKYLQFINIIVSRYFRDKGDKTNFKLFFLLNDILRYWRTLCLNYEERRNDPKLPWRKKNINLKFSRLLTVFGSVLPVIVKPINNEEELMKLIQIRPLERLAFGVDCLNDQDMILRFNDILNIYEEFLKWKELSDPDEYFSVRENSKKLEENRLLFSDFIYASLTHKSISNEYRKFLVI